MSALANVAWALICEAAGADSRLRHGRVPVPDPGAGEILVRVEFSGVNLPDLLMIGGRYQDRPAEPFVPGFEAAGEIVAIGEGVSGLAVGDRVAGLLAAGHGGYCEAAIMRASDAVRLPAGMATATAAAFLTPYGTAWHALVRRGRLQAGERVVVLGSGGSVGLAALEICAALGAPAIGVAGTDERLAASVAAGAAAVVDRRSGGLREAIGSLTDGKGADVCLDLVGGDAFDAMARSMAWGGRLLSVGYASGRIPSLPANLAMLGGFDLIGCYWARSIALDPHAHQEDSTRLLALWARGSLAPRIHAIFPLSEATKALDALRRVEAVGKMLLAMGATGDRSPGGFLTPAPGVA